MTVRAQRVRVLHLNLAAARNRVLAAQIDHTADDDIEWHVAVLGPDGPLRDQLDERHVPLWALGVEDPRHLARTALEVGRLVRAVRPDVVHAHLLWPSVALEAYRVTASNPPPSLHTRHHNRSHHTARRPVHARLDGWVARHATRSVAVSGAVRDTMIKLDKVPAHHVTVIHNGLDASTVKADAVAVSEWRDQFGGGPLAVAVGRLDREKDYPTLLRAVAIAQKAHTDLRLAVAGEGPDGTRNQLQKMTDEMGLADVVRFVGWQNDVFSLVAAADVFVQASLDEALPQSIMEAVVLGVPTAVTTSGGTAEVVGVHQTPVAAGDAPALAKRICSVLENPAAARRAAHAAARETAERFSPQRSADAYLRLYRDLAGGQL